MRVRLTTDRAGVGFQQREGEVIDLPTDEARRLIRAGQAEPVGQPEDRKQPPASRRG